MSEISLWRSPFGESPFGESPFGESSFGESPFGESPTGDLAHIVVSICTRTCITLKIRNLLKMDQILRTRLHSEQISGTPILFSDQILRTRLHSEQLWTSRIYSEPSLARRIWSISVSPANSRFPLIRFPHIPSRSCPNINSICRI